MSQRIAANVKERLDELGLTQVQLAEKLKISTGMASMMLNGEREFGPKYFEATAELLEWPLDKLIKARSLAERTTSRDTSAVAVGGGGPPPGKRPSARR